MSALSTYGPSDYDAMLADPVRTPAYLDAIGQVVRPGDVVVEVGTGVGYFAVAACRAGAKRVYAIEREAAVTLASRIAHENGVADRVVCIRGDARRITLPERGSVLITDLRGILPLLADAIPTFVAARERLLQPDARLIPQHDVIHAAPCVAPPGWTAIELALGDAFAGISRRAMAAYARGCFHRDRLRPALLCAPPVDVATLDYRSIVSPDVDATLVWTIARTAEVAGIGMWFDAHLSDGVKFSTTPAGPRTVYDHGFLPFERAIPAAAGDTLECRFRAKLADGAYVFAWESELRPSGADRPAVTMRQSSLAALLASPAERDQRASSFRPDPATLGLARDLVELADGHRTLAEIGDALLRLHPQRFDTAGEALAWVTRFHAEVVPAQES